MAIKFAVSQRAVHDPAPLTFLDTELALDTTIEIPIGFDLTMLGAQPIEVPGEYGPEAMTAALNYPRFVAAVQAALHGEVDFVYLDHGFHVKEERNTPASQLDGVKVANKLAEVVDQGGLCVEFPLAPQAGGLEAVANFLPNFAGPKMISVDIKSDTDFSAVANYAKKVRAANCRLMLLVNEAKLVEDHASILAELGDIILLRLKDKETTRRLRFLLYAQAEKLGRKVEVYIALGVVISATLQAAKERAMLISELTREPVFPHLPSVIGTVYDIADEVESWVTYGAIDGIIFAPASMPADLASILRGVLPLMQERHRLMQ